MKRTLQCPKCEGRKLWHVERIGLMQPQTTFQVPVGIAYKRSWRGLKTMGALELFACAGCGFAELYADTTSLVANDANGVRFIDIEPEGQLR